MKFISTKSVRLILITAHFMFKRIWELTNGLITFKNSIKDRYIFKVLYFFFQILPIGNVCRNFSRQIYFPLALAAKTVTTWSADYDARMVIILYS